MKIESELWETVGKDAEADQMESFVTRARLGSSEHWPTLMQATSRRDFEHRLALLAPTLDEVVAGITEEAPSFFAPVRARLDQLTARDYALMEKEQAKQAKATEVAEYRQAVATEVNGSAYRNKVAAQIRRLADDDNQPPWLKDDDEDKSSDSDSDDNKDDDDDGDDSSDSKDSDSDSDDSKSDDGSDDDNSKESSLYYVTVDRKLIDTTSSLSDARVLARILGGRVLAKRGGHPKVQGRAAAAVTSNLGDKCINCGGAGDAKSLCRHCNKPIHEDTSEILHILNEGTDANRITYEHGWTHSHSGNKDCDNIEEGGAEPPESFFKAKHSNRTPFDASTAESMVNELEGAFDHGKARRIEQNLQTADIPNQQALLQRIKELRSRNTTSALVTDESQFGGGDPDLPMTGGPDDPPDAPASSAPTAPPVAPGAPGPVAPAPSNVLTLPGHPNPDCTICNGTGITVVQPPDQVGQPMVLPVMAACPSCIQPAVVTALIKKNAVSWWPKPEPEVPLFDENGHPKHDMSQEDAQNNWTDHIQEDKMGIPRGYGDGAFVYPPRTDPNEKILAGQRTAKRKTADDGSGPGDGTSVEMSTIPPCDICGEPAIYDASLPAAGGSWGYVCQKHFDQYGGQVGLGKGQKLVQRQSRKQAMKWSPMSGVGGRERLKEFAPTHVFKPIGWDQFDSRPHPGSKRIAPESPVMIHGKMDPSGSLIHIQDENGNHQTVDRRSVKKSGWDRAINLIQSNRRTAVDWRDQYSVIPKGDGDQYVVTKDDTAQVLFSGSQQECTDWINKKVNDPDHEDSDPMGLRGPAQAKRKTADEMFPGAGAQVHYNEDGEPIGWDYPGSDDPNDDIGSYDPWDQADDDDDDGFSPQSSRRQADIGDPSSPMPDATTGPAPMNPPSPPAPPAPPAAPAPPTVPTSPETGLGGDVGAPAAPVTPAAMTPDPTMPDPASNQVRQDVNAGRTWGPETDPIYDTRDEKDIDDQLYEEEYGPKEDTNSEWNYGVDGPTTSYPKVEHSFGIREAKVWPIVCHGCGNRWTTAKVASNMRCKRCQSADLDLGDDGPTNSWKCDNCGSKVDRYRGEDTVSCPGCNAQYNPFGQRLRDDWRDNASNYDDDIGDMEGFEQGQLRHEHESSKRRVDPRIRAIAKEIRATNPGIDPAKAWTVATETVRRYR